MNTTFFQLVLAGVPGFLTYIWLDKLDAINFDLPEKQTDRTIVLILISLLNTSIGLLIYQHLWGRLQQSTWAVVSLVLVTLLLSVPLAFVYYLIIKMGNLCLTWIQSKLNMSAILNSTPMIEAIKSKKHNEEKLIIIFDFDNNFISSGYANRLPGVGDPTQQLGLLTYGQQWSVDTAQAKYDENSDHSEQIIDFDNKLKIYIIGVYPYS